MMAKKECAATCVFLPRNTTKDILIKSSQTNNLELPFAQMPIWVFHVKKINSNSTWRIK